MNSDTNSISNSKSKPNSPQEESISPISPILSTPDYLIQMGWNISLQFETSDTLSKVQHMIQGPGRQVAIERIKKWIS